VSQHDYDLENQTGASFRSELNTSLGAIVTNNSGATEPAETFPLMWWMDTTTNRLKMRNAADNAWLEIFDFDNSDAVKFIANLGSTSEAGLQFFGDANTGLYSPGADLLGLLAGGTEILRLIFSASGTNNTYASFLGTGAMKLPVGTVAQRPSSPVAGQIRLNSDTNQYEGYANALWSPLGGGGGGGGGIRWVALGGTGPAQMEEYGEIVDLFGAGLAQELYTTVVVPQGYTAGKQVLMYVESYSPSSSNTQLFQAQATLVRPGTTARDSTTNQRTTTNSAVTNDNAKESTVHTLDLTHTDGTINSVAVAAGDRIKVRLYRGTDTDTADLRFVQSSTDLKFT
jgi:hypothetical protein